MRYAYCPCGVCEPAEVDGPPPEEAEPEMAPEDVVVVTASNLRSLNYWISSCSGASSFASTRLNWSMK